MEIYKAFLRRGVIYNAEQTIYERPRWQSYRFILTSIIVTITTANIVRTSRENWAPVVNNVERILRLKKRDLEAEEHVGEPA